MGTKTFDLVETISDLLQRIDEGRKTVRETQNVSDDFWRACAHRDKAAQLLSELVLKVASLGGPAQSQAQAELDRQRSELQKLNDDSSPPVASAQRNGCVHRPFQQRCGSAVRAPSTEARMGRVSSSRWAPWCGRPRFLDRSTYELGSRDARNAVERDAGSCGPDAARAGTAIRTVPHARRCHLEGRVDHIHQRAPRTNSRLECHTTSTLCGDGFWRPKVQRGKAQFSVGMPECARRWWWQDRTTRSLSEVRLDQS